MSNLNRFKQWCKENPFNDEYYAMYFRISDNVFLELTLLEHNNGELSVCKSLRKYNGETFIHDNGESLSSEHIQKVNNTISFYAESFEANVYGHIYIKEVNHG